MQLYTYWRRPPFETGPQQANSLVMQIPIQDIRLSTYGREKTPEKLRYGANQGEKVMFANVLRGTLLLGPFPPKTTFLELHQYQTMPSWEFLAIKPPESVKTGQT